MLSTDNPTRVYLACGSTDMRKSIDGLAAIVTHVYDQDLFSGSLFVFCNRGRDKLKILTWDHNGKRQIVYTFRRSGGRWYNAV